MRDITVDDLKCCGNCGHYTLNEFGNGICLKEFKTTPSHESTCDNWTWDEKYSDER